MVKRINEGVLKIILCAALISVLLPLSALAVAAKEAEVAKVNGTVITQAEFDQEMLRAQQQITRGQGSLSDSQIQALKGDVLESMIGRELVYQESKKQGLKVAQSEVDKQWDRVKGSFPGDAELKAALERMNLTEKAVRMKIERDLAINNIIEEKVVKDVSASEKETRAYYDSHPDSFRRPEEVKASHILIKVDSGADDAEKADAKKRLEEIRKRLKKGEDFAAVATELSEGPSSKNGGDLGYFSRGRMVKPFEDAAFALKTGDISDIVETQFGYHIIKRTDQRPEAVIPFEDVQDRLRESIKNDKSQKRIAEYVAGLKEKAKIERYMKVNSK